MRILKRYFQMFFYILKKYLNELLLRWNILRKIQIRIEVGRAWTQPPFSLRSTYALFQGVEFISISNHNPSQLPYYRPKSLTKNAIWLRKALYILKPRTRSAQAQPMLDIRHSKLGFTDTQGLFLQFHLRVLKHDLSFPIKQAFHLSHPVFFR